MKGTLPAVILVTGVMLTACKKRDFTAGRPTDIRIHNQTETALEEPIDDL
jgi:major membrane immunogen (membrane-anchored lipoprotein)